MVGFCRHSCRRTATAHAPCGHQNDDESVWRCSDGGHAASARKSCPACIAEGLTDRRTDRGAANKLKRWGGRWESNPQRPEPQSGALPVELLPPYFCDYNNSCRQLSDTGG